MPAAAGSAPPPSWPAAHKNPTPFVEGVGLDVEPALGAGGQELLDLPQIAGLLL